ncbi:MAG: YggS family pyridoxal phosphate-dependent enzyme [Mariniphaga sp.]|nr:YggS family pyridoxal phosphate-dependent enzyme [Mariniphaga sp.]MDD4225744.1 YggS family pyridoxal phosphate-dependent enzyme [Mariniphaga sp.]
MDIKKNLDEIKINIPQRIKLVAVSKTKTTEVILEAYRCGQKVFGENKVQELINKHDQLPDDIEWHFIGHLQSNKVKYIAPFVQMIHAIDSLKILKTVNKEAGKNDRVIPCLLQFHIALESTKFGLSEEEARIILSSEEFKNMKNVTIAGVMGMATFTENTDQIRLEFRKLKDIFCRLKMDFFPDDREFKEISMGMSDDYTVAIEEGSTMVRIGSNLFGKRNEHD